MAPATISTEASGPMLALPICGMSAEMDGGVTATPLIPAAGPGVRRHRGLTFRLTTGFRRSKGQGAGLIERAIFTFRHRY
jgi:hypothetical protein